VVYLGANLPAAEIAAAARDQNARAVALSIVYPDDDPAMEGELRLLRKYLPQPAAVLAGGRAVASYEGVLRETNAVMVQNIDEFPAQLDNLRGRGARTPALAGGSVKAWS
jgi:methylmalonyl-CoA mutase cobalamin-binding subunit